VEQHNAPLYSYSVIMARVTDCGIINHLDDYQLARLNCNVIMIPYIYAFWACTPIQIIILNYTFIGAIDHGTHLPLLVGQLAGLSTCGSEIQWSHYTCLIVAQYQETFIMISPDQLAQVSATNKARLKAMNCNKMSTPPSVVNVGLIEA